MIRKEPATGAGLRDERGSLAVEFAILLPLVFALIFAMIDISRFVLARGLVDQLAVELANGMKHDTSPAQRATMTEAVLEGRLFALASDMTGGLIDTSRLELSVFSYEDLPAFVAATAGGGLIGMPEAVTAIRLDYAVPLTTPFASFFYEAGDISRFSILIVKNGR